jgi:hypothetical protein
VTRPIAGLGRVLAYPPAALRAVAPSRHNRNIAAALLAGQALLLFGNPQSAFRTRRVPRTYMLGREPHNDSAVATHESYQAAARGIAGRVKNEPTAISESRKDIGPFGVVFRLLNFWDTANSDIEFLRHRNSDKDTTGSQVARSYKFQTPSPSSFGCQLLRLDRPTVRA